MLFTFGVPSVGKKKSAILAQPVILKDHKIDKNESNIYSLDIFFLVVTYTHKMKLELI